MPENEIRVLIADDHKLMAEGLRLILERAGINVIGIATTGRAAVEQTLKLKPDVVVMDIRMPDMDGLQALASVKAAHTTTEVIMLTSYPSTDHLSRAVALGAAGFLTKDCDAARFPEAVRSAVSGEGVVDMQLLKAALAVSDEASQESRTIADASSPTLTEQESKVLRLITEGLSNATIAELLTVSTNTVKSHVQNIFRKLGVTDRTQAAIWAIRNGLVQ